MPLRTASSALVIGLAACCLPGCSVYKFYRITAMAEPSHFSRKADRIASITKYRKIAKEVWETSGLACPESYTDDDYRDGFVTGFADYIFAGGDGSPPPVPPRRYWCVTERTPEGAARVQSWFAGYRHGAEIARLGKYRDVATVTVSASVRDCTPCGCPDQEGCSTPGPAVSPPVHEVIPGLPPAGAAPSEPAVDGGENEEPDAEEAEPLAPPPSDSLIEVPLPELEMPAPPGDLPAAPQEATETLFDTAGGDYPSRHPLPRPRLVETPAPAFAASPALTERAVLPDPAEAIVPVGGVALPPGAETPPPSEHPMAPMFAR
ncbi:MAG: hypothetical protein AAGJ46_12975 [Planctomycetota bacterium]